MDDPRRTGTAFEMNLFFLIVYHWLLADYKGDRPAGSIASP
jgi:hypothetical protein